LIDWQQSTKLQYIDLLDMHLVPPALNVDDFDQCRLSVTMDNSSYMLLVTVIKHPWSATALSTVGGNAFHEVFLVYM
jgi:hypothetical protein